MKCSNCDERMKLDVHESEAGYYIGYACSNCGPYSRESSGYYPTRESAEYDLKNKSYC